MDLHRAVVVVFFESVKAWIDDSFIFTALFSLTIFPKLVHASSTDSDDLLWHCTSCLRSSQPRVDHRAFSSGELRRLKESDQRQADRFVF